MLIGVLVGVTNLERQSAALIPGSRNLKGDVICGKFQTPSIDFIIGVLSIKKMCERFMVISNNDVSAL